MIEEIRKNKNYKQIVIDENNYKKLKQMGNTGDSFNDVITTILSDFSQIHYKNNQFLNLGENTYAKKF